MTKQEPQKQPFVNTRKLYYLLFIFKKSEEQYECQTKKIPLDSGKMGLCSSFPQHL